MIRLPVTRSTKELSATAISCGDSFDVILTLAAEPDITGNPTDIVLILDRSGSMEQSLPALKNAANIFIDIIDESTDCTQDGQIGGGSQIGIVSFSDTATQNAQTIPNVCPGRRVALAVILMEVDNEDNEFRRGMKTLVIPAHDAPSCRDVVVRCIRFVLPEELDKSDSPDRLCDQRNFKVRFIANYINAGFTCCTLDD